MYEECQWVQAKFQPVTAKYRYPSRMREITYSVLVEASCYEYDGNPLSQTAISEVKEAFSDIASIDEVVANVVKSGVNVVDNVMQVISKIEASTAQE